MAKTTKSGAKRKPRSKPQSLATAMAPARKKAARAEPKTTPAPPPEDTAAEDTPTAAEASVAPAPEAPDPPSDDPPEAAPRRKSSIAGRIVSFGAVLAALIVLAGATKQKWMPFVERFRPQVAEHAPAAPQTAAPEKPAPAAPAGGKAAPSPDTLGQLRAEREQLRSQLKELMARIDTMESAVDNVKDMVRATQPPAEKGIPDPSVEKLNERLDQLEMEGGTLKSLLARVDQLEKSGAGTGPATGIPAGPDASHARALVLAVASLREAIAGGAPFTEALETLTASAGDDAEVKVALAVLDKHATDGIATLATLRDRFDGVAGRIVRAAKAPDDGGWMQRAMGRLASLVTWRRVDGRGDDVSVDAVVARTEERLKAGNLAGAVEAAGRLTGKAAEAAAPWLADAKARLACERAVAALHLHAVSQLAPGKE